jgi:hypothetical protein
MSSCTRFLIVLALRHSKEPDSGGHAVGVDDGRAGAPLVLGHAKLPEPGLPTGEALRHRREHVAQSRSQNSASKAGKAQSIVSCQVVAMIAPPSGGAECMRPVGRAEWMSRLEPLVRPDSGPGPSVAPRAPMTVTGSQVRRPVTESCPGSSPSTAPWVNWLVYRS